MFLLRKVALVLLIAWMSITTFLPVGAQSGWDIRVSLVSTVETPDAMILKTYFNIYDPKTSLPILDAGVTGAQIALPQNNFLTQAEFKKPDVPIYIVMVLDASGSMAGAADQLKQAAKLALNNTPDNSFFSVVQFNEDIKMIQDFTQNIPAVSFAIDQYKVANKGTCLYDAAYSAAESLQKAPPGRRAIILFTDGRDENASGKVCSKHTYQELSDFAQVTQIPISTIGLSFKAEALNEVELRGLAASTGGFSAIAKSDNLSQAFQSIMDGLKAQWMIETLVYPKRGKNEVTLTLDLGKDQTLGATFTIESNTDYPGPPSPVTGEFSGLQFKPEDQSYNVQIAMTSPELAAYVKVAVWDVRGGSKVAEYQFNQLTNYNTFDIPTDALITGREYELRIIAVSKETQERFAWATDSDGKKMQEMIHTFTFDPTANFPSLEIQSVAQQGNDLIVSVKISNASLLGGFDGWLVDENTNTKVPGSDFSSKAISSQSGDVTVPLSGKDIPAGKYTIILRTLGKSSQVYSMAQYSGIAYSPQLPNLFEIISSAMVAAPWVMALVVVIILGVVSFLVYSSMREKSMTGTPVLQGRLGGKLGSGKQSKGSVIPIADEPIPQRGSTPPPQQRSIAPEVEAKPSAPSTLMADNNANATMISAPVQKQPSLTILQSGGAAIPAGLIAITPLPFSIGRVEGALVILEPNVSRKHAQITFDPSSNTYYITDLNSSNGVYVNQQRVLAGKPVPLSSGMVIALGPNVKLRFDLV